MSKWLEQFNSNYKGISNEAKELQEFMKEKTGYKYIPWATMERLTYQQDPEALFEQVRASDGGFVHTSESTIIGYQADNKGLVSETRANNLIHMVIVKLTFLGKTITEPYPIQDAAKGKGMISPKAIDGNLVNKALQRAKARVVSRNTGLALTLYENGDLQFEDEEVEVVEDTPKVTIPKRKAKVTEITETKVKITPESEAKAKELFKVDVEDEADLPFGYTKEVTDLAEEIRNEPKYIKGVQALNTSVLRKYKVPLKIDDTLEDVLSKIDKLEVFAKALKQASGV